MCRIQRSPKTFHRCFSVWKLIVDFVLGVSFGDNIWLWLDLHRRHKNKNIQSRRIPCRCKSNIFEICDSISTFEWIFRRICCASAAFSFTMFSYNQVWKNTQQRINLSEDLWWSSIFTEQRTRSTKEILTTCSAQPCVFRRLSAKEMLESCVVVRWRWRVTFTAITLFAHNFGIVNECQSDLFPLFTIIAFTHANFASNQLHFALHLVIMSPVGAFCNRWSAFYMSSVIFQWWMASLKPRITH